jgi:hypothetical protein
MRAEFRKKKNVFHEEFMKDDKLLKELYQELDTNTVEGFNKLLTKCLPTKDCMHCQMIENKVRICYLALLLQSIGYKKLFGHNFSNGAGSQ